MKEAAVPKTVYLWHLSTKVGNAQHYIGSTDDMERRIREHEAGRGAAFLRYVFGIGIQAKVVRTWEATDDFEWFLKNEYCHSARLCPVCNPETAMRNLAGDYRAFHKIIKHRNRGDRSRRTCQRLAF